MVVGRDGVMKCRHIRVDAEPSEFEEQYDMADGNDLNVCMLMYS